MLVATFAVSDVFAQGGRKRGRQGNQQRGGAQQGQQSNGQQFGRSQNGNRGGNQGNAGNALTVNETQGLIMMREEEKLARDVYTTLNAKWGENVFANISRAESQHMNAVGNLLTRY